jgi:ABC-type molybdate transport system substrate-binding protein
MKKSAIATMSIAFLAITAGWFAHPLAHGRTAQGATSPGITLTIFGAGTLAAPFKEIDDAVMQQHPNVAIQAQFGGSVKMVKQMTELGQIADVVAVADYSVIPKYLFGTNNTSGYADWYVGFATEGRVLSTHEGIADIELPAGTEAGGNGQRGNAFLEGAGMHPSGRCRARADTSCRIERS